MSEHKIPIYHNGPNDKLQLHSYTSLSLVSDVAYVTINNMLYKANLINAKLKTVGYYIIHNHIIYFKEHISKTRIVYSNNLYYLEHLIHDDIDIVIDVELVPICKIKDDDIEFIISKLNIRV